MFSIDSGNVWVGGNRKGKLEDLILFIGSRTYVAKPCSKSGFALFTSGHFYIQRGPDCFEEGVENPRLYDCNTYWGTGWSWCVEGSDHVIWIIHNRYIVPFSGSIILFEGASGKIGSTHNGGPADKFLKSNPINSDGVVAIGPGAVAGGAIAIGGDLNVVG